jgi:hypothetical protein
MPGHSPSKTGVNALMFRASTSSFAHRHEQDVDGRNKSGHDGVTMTE